MLTSKNYVRPTTLDDALKDAKKKRNVVIGGMGWLKMQNRGVDTIVDLSDLGLDKIEEEKDRFTIGAMVTLRQLETHHNLNTEFHNVFKDAVRGIVGVQFRNIATVGGSVFGKFGFSDVISVLLALECRVKLLEAGWMLLSDFLERSIENDIIECVSIPRRDMAVAYECLRLSATDFPIINVVVSKLHNTYRIVIGARPSVAKEEYIDTHEVNEKSIRELVDSFDYQDNMRGSAEYRREMAYVCVNRAIQKCEEQS